MCNLLEASGNVLGPGRLPVGAACSTEYSHRKQTSLIHKKSCAGWSDSGRQQQL